MKNRILALMLACAFTNSAHCASVAGDNEATTSFSDGDVAPLVAEIETLLEALAATANIAKTTSFHELLSSPDYLTVPLACAKFQASLPKINEHMTDPRISALMNESLPQSCINFAMSFESGLKASYPELSSSAFPALHFDQTFLSTIMADDRIPLSVRNLFSRMHEISFKQIPGSIADIQAKIDAVVADIQATRAELAGTKRRRSPISTEASAGSSLGADQRDEDDSDEDESAAPAAASASTETRKRGRK